MHSPVAYLSAAKGVFLLSLTYMCSCRTLIRRSPSSKPYGMFQPIGPNERRSCTKPCTYARPKHSFLNVSGLSQLSKKSGLAMGSS